ncbi:MAG: hypothetical protein AAGJ18_04555, partial [Bacteroidota bacterium]
MSRQLALWLMVFSVIGANAQSSIGLESPELDTRFFDEMKMPKVSGKLVGYQAVKFPDLEIKYILVVPFVERQQVRYAKIEKDGTFDLTIDYPFNYQQIWLYVGDYYHGELLVNEELYVKINLKKLAKRRGAFDDKAVQFGGKDGKLTAYSNK